MTAGEAALNFLKKKNLWMSGPTYIYIYIM